jgi:putative heme-binding domain-containing protein
VAKLFEKKLIIEAVLNPSASIAMGFEAVSVTTKDGKSVAGFVLSAGDPLLIKDLAGNQIAIAANNVATNEKLKASLMPAGGALGLAAQDVADIAAYLVSIRPAE